jgi:hypothetical protein
VKTVFVVIGVLAVLAVCVCGGVGLVSVGGLAAVAGSITPVPTVAARTVGMNEPVQAGEWNVTVTSIEKPGKTLVWSTVGNKTDALGTWVVAYLTLQHQGKTNFTMNYADWQLEDAAGVRYDTKFGENSSYLRFKGLSPLGEQVPPNTVVKSGLVFDVAANATGLKLVLKATKTTFNLGQ